MFFYKECKDFKECSVLFIKNTKERENVAFFWKECKWTCAQPCSAGWWINSHECRFFKIFFHCQLEHFVMLLERYYEILRQEMDFCLLATERICSILGPKCCDATSILIINNLFLQDLFGLDNGDPPVSALTNELQSLSLIRPNVSISTASLQVKILFF